MDVTTALQVRVATESDLPAIVRLLADDVLGATREQYSEPLPDAYRQAFAAMRASTGNDMLVATIEDEIVGCLQLTIIPGLSRLGARRAQIEGVRVARTHRGARIGELLVRDAIARARRAGCALMQLTTDASRSDAHRFYERLGFVTTHVGMKLQLNEA